MQLQYYIQMGKENPLIIDCGSNIGMSILFFKVLYPRAFILGFEPDETTFMKLQENIKKNNLKNVELHRKILSGTEGIKNFYHYPDHPGSLSMSMIREREEKKCQKVESVLLSKYINRTVDFLKLDVEGAEIEVLQELYNCDKLHNIKLMAIDYHHHFEHYHFTQQIDNLSKILGILEDSSFGYQIQADSQLPVKKGQFQPIHIYAYQKNLPI
jgi:FkbM family methyltransferase